MLLRRDELPVSKYPHRYQIGFLIYETASGFQFIWWRTVSQRKFLRKYYKWVTVRSLSDDILSVFHGGDVQRFKRQFFRALPI
jgi:hypothetical protein